MARTLMNQLQMSGSLAYADSASPGAEMAAASSIQADLNNIRALVKDIKGATNWYDAAPSNVQLADLDTHLNASGADLVVKTDIKSADAMGIFTEAGNLVLSASDAAAFTIVEQVAFKERAISGVQSITAQGSSDLELNAASGKQIKMNIDGGTAELQVAGTQVTVVGNFVVQGTTVTVDAETSVVKDPIFQLGGESDGLGGVVAPTLDDNKDRGLSFQWHNGTAAKVGFFGFDDSTGKFTFIPDATITGEVVAGSAGSVVFDAISAGAISAAGSTFGDVQVDITDGYVESINGKQLALKSDLNAVLVDDAADVKGKFRILDGSGAEKLIASQGGALWMAGAAVIEGKATVSGSLDLSNAAKTVEIKGATAESLAFAVGAQKHLVIDTANSAMKLLGDKLELQTAAGAKKVELYTDGTDGLLHAEAVLHLSGTMVQVDNVALELHAAGAQKVSFTDAAGVEKAFIQKDASNNLVVESSAAEILFDDANRAAATLSGYANGIKLSDAAAEWEAFEAVFGTKSIIAAVTAAGGGAAARADEVKTVNASTAFGVTGMDLTAIPAGQRGYRVQVYVNGMLQKPTADYAISSATELTLTYALSADLVTVLYR